MDERATLSSIDVRLFQDEGNGVFTNENEVWSSGGSNLFSVNKTQSVTELGFYDEFTLVIFNSNQCLNKRFK